MTPAKRFGKPSPTALPQEAGSSSPSSIAPFELVEFLQLAGLSRRSIVIAVQAEESEMGKVEVVDGDVWNATVGSLAGTEAMSFLIEEKVPVIAVEPMCYQPETRQITIPLTGLLLQLAKKRDESRAAMTNAEQSADAASGTEHFQLACTAAQRKLPGGCGVILVDLGERASVAVARPQQDSWSGFARDVTRTICILMAAQGDRELDFGVPKSATAGTEKAAEIRQVQHVYLATSRCQYFVTRVPGHPNLAFAMVTGKSVLQGEGWVQLRSALAKIDQPAPKAAPSRNPNHATASEPKIDTATPPQAFQHSASQ